MTKSCLECSKEFEGRADAKFCSTACRVKNKRKGGPIEVTADPYHENGHTGPLEFEIDQDHELKYPGYHNFGLVVERICGAREKGKLTDGCGTHFKTRLAFNRYCSLECKGWIHV